MKSFLVFLIVGFIAVILARPEEKKTTKDDNVDIQEILKIQRYARNFINCVLDKGTCSPDGTEIIKTRLEEEDTTKYDNVDIQQILNNQRYMRYYINCVLDKGHCSPVATEIIKKSFPDALTTNCSKCRDKQKEGSTIFIRHIYKNLPEVWKELEAKYDSGGSYVKRHEAELAAL